MIKSNYIVKNDDNIVKDNYIFKMFDKIKP